MSRLTEYFEMIKAGLKNPEAVLEGVVNSVKLEYGQLPQDEQDEIARRRLICQNCEFTSSNAVKNGYVTDRIDEHCTLCKCPIKTKTAALTQNCGIDVFNRNYPNLKMKLKWEVYTKTN